MNVTIKSFGNETSGDRRALRRFVDFHWQHYADDPQYVPLLDYEYLGFKLIGMTGFFEPSNLFFKHAEMRFFLAERDGAVVGRCNAFVNHRHNEHWGDKVGFLGQFESIDDDSVARALVDAAADWLAGRGMERMRGPQNLPVNEATPGIMTGGFDSRPVIYYSYSKPYYEQLLRSAGLEAVKKVMSWEVPVNNPMEERLVRVSQKVIKRYKVILESWGQRPLKVRRQEMFEIYNDACNDNWGFVPFTQQEFYSIVDDMQLIMDKGLFLFAYVDGEAAAFFGAVPNGFEKMVPLARCRRCELLRALRLILNKGKCEGYRLGYLGVKKKFRNLGLDGVMMWKQKIYSQRKKYQYADLGWVLDDNVRVHRLIEMVGGVLSKTFTIFEKEIKTN